MKYDNDKTTELLFAQGNSIVDVDDYNELKLMDLYNNVLTIDDIPFVDLYSDGSKEKE